jgi:hypothetical protein
MAEIRLVVGLGNPGPEYAETRHNLGFKVIEALELALGIEVKQRKFNARIGAGQYLGKKVILMKPWTFMNRSGEPVATAVGFYKLDLRDLMVVVDDMALEIGSIRVRAGGSAGGPAWPTSSSSARTVALPRRDRRAAQHRGGRPRVGPARIRGEAGPESGDRAGAGCGVVLARIRRGRRERIQRTQETQLKIDEHSESGNRFRNV